MAVLFSHEGEWGEVGVELSDLLGAKAQRDRAGDDRAGRGAADEVEVVAEPDRPAVMLRQQGFDAFEKSDRDRPAHAAAVEREHPLRPGTEQLVVARAGVAVGRARVLGRLAHRSRSNRVGL